MICGVCGKEYDFNKENIGLEFDWDKLIGMGKQRFTFKKMCCSRICALKAVTDLQMILNGELK